MVKVKVKHGLQNNKEIVEVLNRSENKMKIFKAFFFPPGQIGSFPSSKAPLFQVLSFPLQHYFFRNIQHHTNMKNTRHPLHPTPIIRQTFHSLRAAAYLMMRKKKDLRKVNANSVTGYSTELQHEALASLFDTGRGCATILTPSCCQMCLITCNIDYETRQFMKVSVLYELHEHLFAEEVPRSTNQPRNKNSNDTCIFLFHQK